MTRKLEIQFWRKAIRLIQNGYGKGCKVSDLDFDNLKELTRQLKDPDSRCGSCRAKEMLAWISQHIGLLKM